MIYEYGERRWNDIDRGNPKKSEKNLSQSHFIKHKSHMDWRGGEPGNPRWEVGEASTYSSSSFVWVWKRQRSG
jgi:hypothetical protein